MGSVVGRLWVSPEVIPCTLLLCAHERMHVCVWRGVMCVPVRTCMSLDTGDHPQLLSTTFVESESILSLGIA